MLGVDSHAHVFERGLPLAEGWRYAPDYDADVEKYLHLLDAHGLSHGVLVQPSFLGTDNSFMLAALRRHPDRLRGVAVVATDIDAASLRDLSAAGIVGLRLNLIGLPLPDLSAEPWRRLLGKVGQLGWHVEVHREARDLARVLDPLLSAGVNVVVDHFGRPDPDLGIDDPGFRDLLDRAGSGQVRVKLSGAYRNGGAERGDVVATAAIPLLKEAFGLERLVWGSDWPHTQFESSVSYGGAAAQLQAWLPDADERQKVLVETPAKLFRFA